MGPGLRKANFFVELSKLKFLTLVKPLSLLLTLVFQNQVLEGDNTSVMALRTKCSLPFLLGHIFQDVSCLIHGLRWVELNCVKRSANLVAHSLARYARIVLDVSYLA